jgi:hypothetical protein
MRNRLYRRPAIAITLALLLAAFVSTPANAQVTSPKEFFGHNIGDDYWLPTYTQFLAYWQKVAK